MKEGRDYFNPCLFSGCVYLCGVGSQLQLPENHYCCVYVHDSLLVVHSYQYISKFAAGLAGQLTQVSQVRSQTPQYKNLNSQPVVDPAQGLFFIFQQTQALSFNMETGVQAQSFA